MSKYRNMRLDMVEITEKTITILHRRIGGNKAATRALMDQWTEQSWFDAEGLAPEAKTVYGFMEDGLSLRLGLLAAKTVIFSSEQARIFQRMGDTYTESLDYRLPFERVYLQWTSPISLTLGDKELQILGLLLTQLQAAGGVVDTSDPEYIRLTSGEQDAEITYLNSVCAIVKQESGALGAYQISWTHISTDAWLITGELDSDLLKAMAIGCIGYINCENIYLAQEGGAPDAVNRKRERDGKKILEPYYVCRIRGVQYDSNGNATGEGTHHGFRYDVRGHFRKLSTGKTTWVRPHQRGVQHELYVPKTYVVPKEPTV